MNFFSFLASWFSKQAKSILKLQKKLDPLIQKAVTVSTALSTEVGDVGALTHDQRLVKVQSFLQKFVKDATVVESFLAGAVAMPWPNVLLNAASIALSYLHFGGLQGILVDIQTALQLSHGIFAQDNPRQAGSATAASLLVKV